MISEKYEFQSDFALRYMAEGKAAGKAEGRASAVIGVFEARGIALTAEERARILACTELDVLDAWIRRAVTIQRVEELLG